MNDSHLITITQIKTFLKLDNTIKFKSVSKIEKYQWIDDVLMKFRYFRLRKKDKSIIRKYIIQMTGLSKAQLTRAIGKKRKFGRILLNSTNRYRFPVKYDTNDISLLTKTDNIHNRLSGPATKKIFKREHEKFNKSEYKRLKDISVSHIYNLRETRQYKSHSLTIKGTNSIQIPIGKRDKPEPNGQPGYLRVDTVHQGDLPAGKAGMNKEKGVYHINIVDEVLQWEIVGCVEKISEQYLEPLLKDLIDQFPFVIHNFHSDNGSEYINKIVAKLLNKLLIKQTKSRARHCNDNALAESKNGSIVRKHMGYVHIKQKHAPFINKYYRQYFNIYLNYHRPCGYATIITDSKGKQKKVYKTKDYQTPYEKLKSLKHAKTYLKPSITFKILDKIAYQKSDNEYAVLVSKQKQILFNKLKQSFNF